MSQVNTAVESNLKDIQLFSQTRECYLIIPLIHKTSVWKISRSTG